MLLVPLSAYAYAILRPRIPPTFLFFTNFVRPSSTAATHTATFPTPPTRTGWEAGAAANTGRALFNDPDKGTNQYITLTSSSDVTGPWSNSITMGGGTPFSVCYWLMIGPGTEATMTSSVVSPGVFFSGGSQALNIVVTKQLGGFLVLAVYSGSYAYAEISPSLPWAYWQWFHICATFSSSSWLFYRDGTVISPTQTSGGSFSSNTETAIKYAGGQHSGVAQVQFWLNYALSGTEVSQFARAPPSSISGSPPYIDGLPSTMSQCSSVTITLYAPFNLYNIYTVASGTITVSSSDAGVTFTPSAVVTFSSGTNWQGTVTINTPFASLLTTMTLTFTSSLPNTQMSSTTRTVWLTSASAILKQAVMSSQFSATTYGWTTPGPSGVTGTGVSTIASDPYQWQWNSANLGGSGMPTWNGYTGWTFGFWLNPVTNENTFYPISSGTGSNAFNVEASVSSQFIRVESYAGATAVSKTFNVLSSTWVFNTWSHLLIRGDKFGMVSVFLNGAPIGFTYNAALSYSWPLPMPINVARTMVTTGWTSGILASIRYFNTHLTSEAIAVLAQFKPNNLQDFAVSSVTVAKFSDSTGTLQIYPVSQGSVTLTPSYTAGSPGLYNLGTLSYSIYSLKFTATLSSGTATLDWGCTLATQSLSLTSGTASNWVWLNNGTTTAAVTTNFRITSSNDQIYVFQVVRALPDVSGIALTQYRSGSVSNGALTLTPSFTQGSNTIVYSASVYGYIVDVTAVITFGTASSITIYKDTTLFQSGLTTGTASNHLTLNGAPAITTQFQVVSTMDGPYTIIISKVLDVTNLVATQKTAGGVTSTAIQLTPAFTVGTMSYNFIVPYIYTEIAVTMNYSLSTVSLYWCGSGPYPGPASGALSSYGSFPSTGVFWPLLLVSTYDGTYSISAKRLAQDVTAFTAYCDSVGGATGTAFSFPAFTAGQFSYTLNVVSQWFQCALAITYGTDSTITISYPPMSISNQAAPATTVLTSTKFTLTVGTSQSITVISTRDGTYTLTIVRGSWDVTAFALRVGTGGSGSTNPAALTYTPGFTSGSFSYTATASVYYVYTGVALSATFSGTASGKLNTGSTVGLTSGAGTYSSPFLLSTGANTLALISTQDSTYSITITRDSAVVSSIVFRGQNSAATVSQAFPTLTPTFAVGTYSYTLTVPYVYNELGCAVTYSAGSMTIQLNSGGTATPATTVYTTYYAIATGAGTNVFTAASDRDGTFTITVTRSNPDVSDIILSLSPSILTAPSTFTPGSLTYTAVVPYITSTISVTSLFSVTSSVTLTINAASIGGMTTNTASSPATALNVGANTINIVSTQDGTYVFTVTRNVQDVSSFGASCDSVSGTTDSAFPFPAFTAGQFTYTLNLVSQWYQCAIVITYATPSTNTISYSPMSISNQAAPATTVLTSTKFTLTVGTSQSITVISTRDGTYTLTIVRGAWSVSQLALRIGEGVTGDSSLSSVSYSPSPFTSGSLAYTLNVYYRSTGIQLAAVFSTTATVDLDNTDSTALTSGITNWSPTFLLTTTGTHVLHLVTPQDSTYSITITRDSAVVSSIVFRGQNSAATVSQAFPTLTPTFAVGTYSYTLTVPYVYNELGCAVTYSAGSMTIQLNSGGTATPATTVYTTYYAIATGAGTNVFTAASDRDGTFTITVTRSNPDVSDILLGLPPLVLSGPGTFVGGSLSYTAVVPYITSAVTVKPVFTVAGSVTLTINAAALGTLTTNTASAPATGLVVGSNTIDVVSSQDGTYQFSITRNTQDVSAFTASCDSVSGATGTSFNFPAFTADQFSYTLNLVAQWHQCAIAITYGTPSTNTISYSPMSISNQAAPATTVLTSTKFTLTVGTSQSITVISTRDGTYTLTIVRGAWSVSQLALRIGEGVTGDSSLSSVSYSPSPFTSGSLAYTLNVYYRSTGIQLAAVFSTTATVDLDNTDSTALTSGITNWSPTFLLTTTGTHVLHLVTPQDSTYSITITRDSAVVSSIVFRGQNSAATVSQAFPTLTPTFAVGTYSYTLTVPYVYNELGCAVTYSAGSMTIQLNSGGTATPATTVYTTYYAIATGAGTNVFTAASDRDGTFTITVTRSNPDVSDIILSLSPSILTAPSTFTPGSLTYTAVVPYITSTISVTSLFSVTSSVTLTINAASIGGMTTNTASSPATALNVGANTINIVSTQDGTYVFTVTRNVQDVSLIAVSGISSLSGATWSVVLVPAWTVDVFEYTGSLAAAYDTYSATITYGAPGSITGVTSNNSVVTVPATGTPSDLQWLNFGTLDLIVDSDRDGVYKISLTRSVGDVSTVITNVQPNPLSTTSLASYRVQTTPAFFGGVHFSLSAIVDYAYSHCTFTPDFRTVSSSSTLTIQAGAYNAPILTGATTPGLGLSVGANTITMLNSVDGLYTYTITRSAPDMDFANAIVTVMSQADNISNATAVTAPVVLLSAVYSYSIVVPFAFVGLKFNASFSTPGSVHVDVDALPSPSLSLITAVETPVFPLTVGVHQLSIDSTKDGRYLISVERLPEDVQSVVLKGYHDVATTQLHSDLTSSLAAEVVPAGTLTVQSVSIPFTIYAVTVTVVFGASSVDARLGSSAAVPLTSGVDSSFSLAIGLNTLTISSSYDGLRVLEITRAAPDVSALSLIGLFASGGVSASSFTLAPAFAPSTVVSYTVAVPYAIASLQIQSSFGALNNADITATSSSTSTTLPLSLVTDVPSSSFALRYSPATTSFDVRYTLDGLYTVTVSRAAQDVTSVTVIGYTIQGGATPFTLSIVPAFTAHNFQYNVSMPFKVDRFTIQLTYSHANSINLTYVTNGVTSFSVAPSSTVESATKFALGVFPAINKLILASTRDGNYSISLIRAVPAVVNLEVFGGFGPAGVLYPTLVTFSPAYSPGVLTGYSVVLPYVYRGITLRATFGSDTVVSKWNGVSVLNLSSGTSTTTTYTLNIGTSTLTLNSTADSVYSFSITRAPADVSALDVSGITIQPTPTFPLLTSSLTPSFAPAQFSYSMTVPFVVGQVAFRAVFGSLGGVSVLTSTANTFSAPIALTSNVYSGNYPIVASPGTNKFYMSSSADGFYNVTVIRSSPDLVGLSFWEYTTSDLYTLTPLVFSPSFQPGVESDYTLTLQYSSAKVAVMPTFSVANSVSLVVNGVAQQLTSGTKSTFYDIAELPVENRWTLISTQDGEYQIKITRATFNPCLSGTTLCFNNGNCTAVGPSDPTAYTCQCTYGFSGSDCKTNQFPIEVPSGVDTPIAEIDGAETRTVGPCSLVELNGDKSYGFGSHINTATFEWKLESFTTPAGRTYYANISTVLAPVPPFNETLGGSLGDFSGGEKAEESKLYIPAYLLADNSTYVFSLTVGSSAFPRSSKTSVTITKLAVGGISWLPQISVQTPTSVTRSVATEFAVDISRSTCAPLPGDVQYAFAWTVDAVTDSAGATLAVPVTAYTSTVRSMSIPSKTLLAGVTYSVTLVLTSSSLSAGAAIGSSRRLFAVVSGVTTSTSMITVEHQPLVAKILGGYRQKSVDVSFTIDGSLSSDPDYAGPANVAPFTFEWSATYVPNPNPSNLAPVTVAFPANIALTNAQLAVPANSLLDIVTNPILLTVTLKITSTTDSRVATTPVQVDLVPKPAVPLPTVGLTAPQYLNPGQTLTIVGTIVSDRTPSYQMICTWTCISDPSLDLTSPLVISSNPGVSNLVIRAGQLQPGFYTFQLKASEPAYVNAAQPVFAVAQTTLYVNAPPTGGFCTATPPTGESLVTPITITCKQWYDPQQLEPLKYAINYYNLDTDTTMSNRKILQPAQSSATYTTVFPSGRMMLEVSIIDTAGATAIYQLPLNVTLPAAALADPLCYAKNMSSLLNSAVSQQDQSAAFLVINQLSDVLNSAGSNPNSGSSCGSSGSNATSSSGSSLTNEIRQNLLDAVTAVVGADKNQTLSPTQVQYVSQTLNSLTSDPKALNDSKFWESTQNLLDHAIKSIPPGSDNTALTNNLANTVSNLLIDCAYLDKISGLTQDLLSATLAGTVSNSGSNNLNTTNLQASATRGEIGAGAEITLPNGVKVTLTAEALAQYANRTAVTKDNADTASGQATLALDTRIVTFDPKWASCRNDSSSGQVKSELTTIDITLSNGQVVDITDLLAPISFLIPFNMSKAGLEAPTDECGNKNLDPDSLASSLLCGYWNVKNQSWSTSGCRNLGFANNGTAVQCSCGHLTEFAILYKAELAKAHAGMCGVGDTDSSLGLFYYLIFFGLYLFVALVATMQSSRVLATTKCKHWLMLVEHALVMSVGLFRAWNMANFYVLYQYIPLVQITIIAGIPHLFYPWIFTFVIFAWAAIYHASIAGKREDNPFKNYQHIFVIINSAVSLALFTIFVLMSQADIETQGKLNQLGVIIISLVCILFAIFFIVYGLLLVRSLTKDFSSPYARKLFTVAVSFSFCFFATSGILLFSVVNEKMYNENLMLFNIIYFSLDVIALTIVMGLFAKSISDSITAHERARDDATAGTGSIMTKSDRTVGTVATTIGKTKVSSNGGYPQKKGSQAGATKISVHIASAHDPKNPLDPDDDPDNPWKIEASHSDNPWAIDSEDDKEDDFWATSSPVLAEDPAASPASPSAGFKPAGSPQFTRGRMNHLAAYSKYVVKSDEGVTASKAREPETPTMPAETAPVTPAPTVIQLPLSIQIPKLIKPNKFMPIGRGGVRGTLAAQQGASKNDANEPPVVTSDIVLKPATDSPTSVTSRLSLQSSQSPTASPTSSLPTSPQFAAQSPKTTPPLFISPRLGGKVALLSKYGTAKKKDGAVRAQVSLDNDDDDSLADLKLNETEKTTALSAAVTKTIDYTVVSPDSPAAALQAAFVASATEQYSAVRVSPPAAFNPRMRGGRYMPAAAHSAGVKGSGIASVTAQLSRESDTDGSDTVRESVSHKSSKSHDSDSPDVDPTQTLVRSESPNPGAPKDPNRLELPNATMPNVTVDSPWTGPMLTISVIAPTPKHQPAADGIPITPTNKRFRPFSADTTEAEIRSFYLDMGPTDEKPLALIAPKPTPPSSTTPRESVSEGNLDALLSSEDGDDVERVLTVKSVAPGARINARSMTAPAGRFASAGSNMKLPPSAQYGRRAVVKEVAESNAGVHAPSLTKLQTYLRSGEAVEPLTSPPRSSLPSSSSYMTPASASPEPEHIFAPRHNSLTSPDSADASKAGSRPGSREKIAPSPMIEVSSPSIDALDALMSPDQQQQLEEDILSRPRSLPISTPIAMSPTNRRGVQSKVIPMIGRGASRASYEQTRINDARE